MTTGRPGPDTRPGKGGTDITVDMFVKTMKSYENAVGSKPCRRQFGFETNSNKEPGDCAVLTKVYKCVIEVLRADLC